MADALAEVRWESDVVEVVVDLVCGQRIGHIGDS